jgi:hypothetical protein
MVGPDLIGMAGAVGFLLVILSIYALIDRLVCGAWEALNGSPGWGLVRGMTVWAERPESGLESRRVVSSPASPAGGPPQAAEPVATERVTHPRIGGPMRFAALRA